MQLHCRLIPKDEKMRQQLVARLLALGFEPKWEDSSVVLDYEGACDGKALSAITVFESFGCDRAIIFKDWGSNSGEGQNQTQKTRLTLTLAS